MNRACSTRAGLQGSRTYLARLIFLVLFVCVLPCIRLSARGPASAGDDAARTPAAEIDLLPLGYAGLSPGARQAGGSNLSVDFLDSHHVLVTFNPKKLFKRLPDCPPTHADRLIHAVVMEVPSGKVVKEADWYLHDLRRYVWNLGGGRVLLRRLNRLYELNSNLEEKLVFDSPKDLLWVTVTADGKQIVVESSAGSGTANDPTEEKLKEDEQKKERVQVSFLDASSLIVQRTISVRGRIRLESTSSGFADVRHQGATTWLVEFGNAHITRVKSRPAPDLLYGSANTVLVGRCAVSHKGYNLSAFTLTGTFLWRQQWEDCRFSPVVRDGEDGTRFAAGTLSIRRIRTATGENEQNDSTEEALVQHVQVLDTATGNSVLSLTVAPAVMDGHNFALSPDGRMLAAVEGNAVRLYKLPEMSPDDRARSIAVKADAPSLSVPSAQPGKAGEEPIYSASEDEDASEARPVKEAAASGASNAADKSTDSKPEPIPALTIRTGTQVVAVDVVVTDSAGHLVKGLKESDFQVLEDGKPQAVRYFKEMSGGERPVEAPRPAMKEVLAPNVFSNSALPAEEGAVTLVLLDLLNTPMADQAYAQDELIKFLKSKPADAKFALCILGNRLEMIQGFTGDQATLLAAAKGKKASQRNRPLWRSAAAEQTPFEGNRVSTRFEPTLDSFASAYALQESELRLVNADQRMEVTVNAFAHLARYLAGVPGRKNLVWLSGSFLLGIYPDSNGQNPFLGTRDYGDNLKKVANLLGEAHVAVYPVDVQGLQTNPLFTAANENLTSPMSQQPLFPADPVITPRGLFSRNPNLGVPASTLSDQVGQFDLSQADEHATMSELAAHTGGEAFFNTNGIAQAIHAAEEQGANYYALSYTPSNKKYDGSFRKVKVTIAGKRYRLAYRSGYYAMDSFAPANPSKDLASSLARAAMQAGSPQSRQILFGARVVPVGKPRVLENSPADTKPSKKNKVPQTPVEVQRYAIDHAVNFSDLHFGQTPGGSYHDLLNFMVTAFDERSTLVASQIARTKADFSPEAMKDVVAGGVRMHQEIEVPVKSTTMRVGVEDLSNGHIGTIEIRLPVPPPPEVQAGARRALPPVEPD
jgi:VWFA-related protein